MTSIIKTMRKKDASVMPHKEVVYSEKYKCNLTKCDAIFDESQNSWINEKIENNLKDKK